MSSFRVETAFVDGVERISPRGELDRAAVGDLELSLLTANDRPVVLDLTDCEFIDSSGIALIVEHWRQRDGRLTLAGARAQAARILEITGIGATIGAFDSFEEACAALRDDGGRGPAAHVR